jgi:TIR domain
MPLAFHDEWQQIKTTEAFLNEVLKVALNKMTTETPDVFDVFLSHSHEDSIIVEMLGAKLEDEAHLRVWLDKWILVPGNHWQQEMARGLEQARTCAVCISRDTPKGWFRAEIERALNRQVRDESFRVIPILLSNGDCNIVDDFLELRTWVEFKKGIEDSRAFHVLVSGIQGKSPGRYRYLENASADLAVARAKLWKLKNLREERLIDDDIAVEFQRRVIDEILR